jgi:tetratricopeptide (TPR) repeat protein
MQEVTLKYLATKMKALKEREQGSTILFLGAGVSRSAGIPLASEIMEELERDDVYKDFIEQKCKEKTYARYMDALPSADRRRFFKKFIEISNINTSHLYAAHLIAEGYVDCVVTTNFDNLMLKSLTLFNINPSVYDLTIARDNITANFEFPAVIYLHGQHHGFWQLNTDYELELPVNAISKAITKISTNRAWVVIGYSGNDPVLNQLASIDNFAEGLFWIGYKEDLPSQKVRDLLLDKNTNGSNYIKGFTSDDFFRKLKIELGMDEPPIIKKPFSQLLSIISHVQPVVIDSREVDLCLEARNQIEQAIKGFEKREGFENKPETSKERIEEDELIRRVKEIYNSANYSEIKNYEDDIKVSSNPELIKTYSYIYWDWGWSLSNASLEKSGADKEKLLLESIEKTKKAIDILPDATLYDNWGWALGQLAALKNQPDKEKLLWESIEKRKKAIGLNPNYDQAYFNWGWSLGELSVLKTGKEKEELLLDSIEKYKNATLINPNHDQAYFNWGWALSELAMEKSGVERENLLLESIEKRKKTTEINPGYYNAYHNWGWALGEIAMMKNGIEKEKYILDCIEKYKKVLEINPNYELAFNNWGWSLGILAELKTGEEKEKLLLESIEKYKKSIEINPNYKLSYENWGWGLSNLAELKSGGEKERLLNESKEKYNKAKEMSDV